MGRPARLDDQHLRERLRSAMTSRGMSASDVAKVLGVSRATVHRALQTGTFSRPVQLAAAGFVGSSTTDRHLQGLLQESLHLLGLSDKLRKEAERMIFLALDQSGQTQ